MNNGMSVTPEMLEKINKALNEPINKTNAVLILII